LSNLSNIYFVVAVFK